MTTATEIQKAAEELTACIKKHSLLDGDDLRSAVNLVLATKYAPFLVESGYVCDYRLLLRDVTHHREKTLQDLESDG